MSTYYIFTDKKIITLEFIKMKQIRNTVSFGLINTDGVALLALS